MNRLGIAAIAGTIFIAGCGEKPAPGTFLVNKSEKSAYSGIRFAPTLTEVTIRNQQAEAKLKTEIAERERLKPSPPVDVVEKVRSRTDELFQKLKESANQGNPPSSPTSKESIPMM